MVRYSLMQGNMSHFFDILGKVVMFNNLCSCILYYGGSQPMTGQIKSIPFMLTGIMVVEQVDQLTEAHLYGNKRDLAYISLNMFSRYIKFMNKKKLCL